LKEQQLLRDPNTEPSGEVIAGCLGSANGAYLKFIEQLKNYDIQVDWRYCNDGKTCRRNEQYDHEDVQYL
jgi:hypothetical protein